MNTRLSLKRLRDKNVSSTDNIDPKKSREKADIAPFNPCDLQKVLLPSLKVILASDLLNSSRSHVSAIKDKLLTGKYSNARDYVEDVWSMFEDVRLSNNNSTSEHYAKLADVFEHSANPVMVSLGYCCGQNYKFDPQILCCSLKVEECTIAIDAHYFTYETRHNICEACFTNIPGDTLTLDDEKSSPQTHLRKDQFTKVKNNIRTPEPFIDCQDCGRRQHKICVLYSEKIWLNGFVCENCLAMKSAERDENQFRAKNLPVTKLDEHIEARVNNFLKMNNFDGGRVHIRMLLNVDKNVTVKPAMRKMFVESGELSAAFPYRSKAVFAFQEIDGIDVCFFGMYIQEYGSECPDPNTRRIFIEFMDSVNFFQPKSFRTFVYYEILLGYMDFAKQLGYTWLHIWACPPPPGEHYIFFSHPPDQKVPDSVRLRRWYTKILQQGKNEHIIVNYKSTLEQFKDDISPYAKGDNDAAVVRLPYFDEDYWPYFFEEAIEKIDKKSKTVKKRQSDSKRKSKRQCNSNTTGSIHRRRSYLRSKLLSSMADLSQNFFSVQLHSTESAATLDPIRDPDNFVDRFIMNGHSAFFDFARDNNYEFSSLRRAKFSTMCILYELHNHEIKTQLYVCNMCELHVPTWYYCIVCEDYALCANCNEKTDHEHEIRKMGLQSIAESSIISLSDTIEINSDVPNGDDTLPSDLATKLNTLSSDRSDTPPISMETIEKSINSHACQCTDRNCQIPSCQLTKCFDRHITSCRNTNGTCHICKTLNTVLSNHSDSCRIDNCSFSFCNSTKAQIQWKLEQQKDKEFNGIIMNIAAYLQKTSLEIVDNRDACRNQQFLLNLAANLLNAQIQLQKLLEANYVDCAARIQNAETTDSMSRDQDGGSQSRQFMDFP